MTSRDIIVIGASAGGFEAIQQVASGFPPDFAAAVFVTLHQHPRSAGMLVPMLNRVGPLLALNADDGMAVEQGRIYVAPPDYHLIVQNGFMQLSHGPRENLQRPCINVMFRSAATAYGERVSGVLLTGLLDDGAAGLWEIQQHGGATIVQDPEEATFRSMPDSAIRGLNVQYIVRLREMAPLLARLNLADQNHNPPLQPEVEIENAGQVCAECGGAMTVKRMGQLVEFRCHTGHRFGLKSLISQKTGVIEQALSQALSQSEELADLLRIARTQADPQQAAEIDEEIRRRVEEQEAFRRILQASRDVSELV